MFKKIGLSLLLTTNLLITAPVFSITEEAWRQGFSVEYAFLPNEPHVYANVFMWTVSLSCKVVSESYSNLLSVTVLRKSGSVNGRPVFAGDQVLLEGKPGDIFNISSERGSKIEATNIGLAPFSLVCSTI